MCHSSRQLDLWGAGLSLACGAHCLGLTLALAAMPAAWLRGELLGLPLSWWRVAELTLTACAFAVALFALIRGWRRHRTWGPVLVGGGGMALIASGLGLPLSHPLTASCLVLVGGFALMGAHLFNLARLRRAAAGVA